MPAPVFATLLATFVLLSLNAVPTGAADSTVNPHSENGDCGVCHVASVAKLRSWFAFGSTKKELTDDRNKLCQKCHVVQIASPDGVVGVGAGHATGKKTAINHQNLPLLSDGTINCATTCHNMHVTSDDAHQQRKHLRLTINELCISCHDR